MTQSVRLGMLTPSSNTSLEPITQTMVSGLPEVSVHFSRFKVTEIALSDAALAQLDPLDDIHASADYRGQLVRVLTARVLRAAVADARRRG